MKKMFLLLIILFLAGCNSDVVAIKHYYYPNGNLKKTTYGTKIGVDSIVYYYDSKKPIVKTIKYLKDNDIYYQKDFFENGNLMRKGFLLRDNFRVCKWDLYTPNNYKGEVVEYFNIRNQPYVNQSWKLDNNGDTLVGGNYFSLIRKKDTISLHESNRFHFFLSQKALDQSEVFICIPKRGEYVFSDFSNEFDMVWDTIKNMSREFENHPIYKEWKYDVMFELMSTKIGNDTLKGFLLEKEVVPTNDSVDFITRKIYFKIPYYVKDDSDRLNL